MARAQKSVSKKVAPANGIATVVAQAPVATTVPAPAPAKNTLGFSAVTFAKPYKVKADHNSEWFAKVAPLVAENKQALVSDIVQQGVPVRFVGYLVRRGYLSAVKG